VPDQGVASQVHPGLSRLGRHNLAFGIVEDAALRLDK
jgi:hypothetical protein